jgi:dihydrofolate reductase
MGKIVANVFASLDGVTEAPETWHFPWMDQEMGAILGGSAQTQTAYLFGRITYDIWAASWPQRGSEDPFAGYINSIPKYLLTHRDVDADAWTGTQVIGSDPVAELTRLKQESPGDIAVPGSMATLAWLIANGLLDEIDILVHPILVGHGRRLFDSADSAALELIESTTLGSGVIHSRYRVS